MVRKKAMLKSIRGRIIVQMLLFSLIPLLVVGSLVYYSMSNAQDTADTSVDDARADMQDNVVGVQLTNEAHALNLQMVYHGTNFAEEVGKIACAPSLMNLAVGKGDAASVAAFLDSQRSFLPNIKDLTVIDRSGNPLATSNKYGVPVSEMDNQVHDSWFRMALSPLGVGYGGLDTASGKDGIEATMAIPIPDPADPTNTDPSSAVGVLRGVMEWDLVQRATEHAEKFKGGRVIIFGSASGLVWDTADINRAAEETWIKTDLEEAVVNTYEGGEGGYTSGHMMMGDSISGYYCTNLGSVEGLGVLEKLFGMASNTWIGVIVQQPHTDAFASLNPLDVLEDDLENSTNDMIITLVAIVMAVIIGVLGMAFYLGRNITRPILNLHRGVEEVMSGNLDHRVGSGGMDEIGELSRAFDEMTGIVKNSQAELEETNANLEQMVEDRTKKLKEEVVERERAEAELKEKTALLIQSEKMSSMGTMVNGVAHELNNPMTGIINYAQHCIKKTEETDTRLPVLKDIEKEARRCANIIWNMVTFARMEAEGEEEFGDHNIPELLDRVLMLLAYPIKSEEIKVTTDYPEDLPEVSVQSTNIEQVFLNLVDNAIDALADTENKEIRIEGRLSDGFVEIAVSDNGPGMLPEVLKKIFDPFYTTKTVGQGIGLGLSVCHSICRQHGGDLTCESEVGKGTTFIVKLLIARGKCQMTNERKSQNSGWVLSCH